ncbi:hypothetical protein Q8A73_020622 [Channa argus]|nr:hypothetical protein Q8A73_020622 [Channa argus]
MIVLRISGPRRVKCAVGDDYHGRKGGRASLETRNASKLSVAPNLAAQRGMIASNLSLNCAHCPVERAAATTATTYAYEEWSGSLPPPSLSPTGHLVVAVCLGFIGTSGFLSNFLVLTLFCRYRVLRTPMNLLLVSISVSDLLVSVLGTPFSFAASTQGRWLIGRTGCVWYGFVNACLGKQMFVFDDQHLH